MLTGLTLTAVNNAIDRKLVSAVVRTQAGRIARLLSREALFSLTLERRLADRFVPGLRRQVFEAAATSSLNTLSLDNGFLKLDLREPRRELASSLRALKRLQQLVTNDPAILGGEPVFRETRVPVHPIAGFLAEGAIMSDLLAAYPRLTPEMIELAPAFATAYPRGKRPRKLPWRDQAPIHRAAATGPSQAAKFLIDECLSIELVTVAAEIGYEALHVAQLGQRCWKDAQVLRYSSDGSYVLVTNNATDFRRFLAAEANHRGIVIMMEAGRRLQRQMFTETLNRFALRDSMNQILEVDLSRGELCFTNYDYPVTR